MKAFLALLLVVVCFVAYQERQRIGSLEADLESARQQLESARQELDTTKKQVDALKAQLAQEGATVINPGQPGAPPVVKKSGQWMFDPHRVGPLDHGGKP